MDIGKDLQTAYNDGYKQGVLDFAERIKKYYNAVGGETFGALVAYTIDQKAKEMTTDEA